VWKWPWQRRRLPLLAVTTVDAGDDATAALTMIVQCHYRNVTVEDVRRAVYTDPATRIPTAFDIVRAAEQFGMRARGVRIDDPAALLHVPTPSIAHLSRARAPFPQPIDGAATFFAVLETVRALYASWIDPDVGRVEATPAAFLEHSTGVFLLLDAGAALPRAHAIPPRKPR
jgi:ABC-type bacteriocin/lantibiotic exporter with double-glycine peptidase domain